MPRKLLMHTIIRTLILIVLLAHFAPAQDIKILINHIGYETTAHKSAILLAHPGDDIASFKLIDDPSGKEILSGVPTKIGPVDHWKDWIFWTADFTPAQTGGAYRLECLAGSRAVRSFPFLIQPNLLERNTLSNVIYYFKSQRCSGQLDKADQNLRFEGSDKSADVHGGWFDATGDYGKHLSPLSFSTYFNPQQIPMTDWTLFKSCELLQQRGDPNFRQYKRRLLDEALFGADYLVRVKNPAGSFYRSVDGPGGEKKPDDRRIAKEGQGFAIKTLATKNESPNGDLPALSGSFPFEVGYRNGGGVAIAALAIASTSSATGEFPAADYLKAAKDAFAFLEKHNLEYANDHKENIVDDYGALLAATELFKSTKDNQYRAAADHRAANLMARLITRNGLTYFRADDTDRPFFHAADAGLPVVALLNYYEIADPATQSKVLAIVRQSLESELRITAEVPNAFGYARQYIQHENGERETAFFYPHDAETAPWWQGENARLASLAAAARSAARYFKTDPAFHEKLETYAADQLNWILGRNPYDCCMLHGSGRNNPAYMFFDAYEYTNAPGGICNGITAGYTNPHDIDFHLPFTITGKDEDWRWGEQWLPHASWYLYAVSVGN